MGATMNSTNVLRQEHDTIERALRLLAKSVRQIRGGGTLPAGFQAWIVDFIREFADRRHHAKEEQVFFPLLEQRGIPRHGGPIGCMLHEHELGRELLAAMAEPVGADGSGRLRFAAAAEQYVALLSQHIFKENHILFAMAEQACSTDDDHDALSAFRRLDHELPTCETLDNAIQSWDSALAEPEAQTRSES